MLQSSNGTHYELNGNRRNPPVVLIHGLGLRLSLWRDYISVLAENYFIINYDLFGHGASEPPPSVPSLVLFSEQLKDLLNEIKVESASIIGFSLGGMINRRFAMDYSDRVQSLIILSSPHERDPKEQLLVEERAKKTAKGGPSATLDSTLKRWFTADFLSSQPNEIGRVRDWVLSNDSTIYAQCRFVLAAGVKELIQPNPPINKPTLVATCENDSGSTPEMTLSIASEIKDAKSAIVPELQHLGLIERPDLFLDLIQKFLERNK